MDFYFMLSDRYDDIFPFSETTAGFIKSYTPRGGNILDIGSATGKYLKHFNDNGYEAYGIEYCPELIKFKESTVIGDMNQLPFKGNFDTVVCAGNTLVHAESYSHADEIMKNMSGLLKPDGHMIVQILNYEQIMKKKPESLPAIKTDSCTFERHYEYVGNRINFTGTLTVHGKKHSATVPLCPITPRELMDMGFQAGFREITYFSGFDREAFDIDRSFALTAVMSK